MLESVAITRKLSRTTYHIYNSKSLSDWYVCWYKPYGTQKQRSSYIIKTEYTREQA